MSSLPTDPTLPLTYPDAVCFDDLDGFGNETASDLETLEQDIYHALIEQENSNIDDPDRSCGLEEALSGTEQDLRDKVSQIGPKLSRDDRIDAANATMAINADGSYTINVDVQVSGAVLSLSFGLDRVNGLTVLS